MIRTPSLPPASGSGFLRSPGPPPPLDAWTARLARHWVQLLLFFLVALAVTLFFPPSTGLRVSSYEAGMVAEEDVIASLSFAVPKTLDELGFERSSAALAVPPTFELDPGAADSTAASLTRFFEAVDSVEVAEDPALALDELLLGVGLSLPEAQAEVLLDPEPRALLAETALRAAEELLRGGVLDDAARLDPASTGRILVVSPEGGERYITRDDALTSGAFYERAAGLLPEGTGSEVNDLLRLSLIRFMVPTLRYDPVATQVDRDAARRAVPVLRANVLEGEAVVRANQQLGDAEIERLRAYEAALRTEGQLEDPRLRVRGLLASMTMYLLILAIFGILLFFYRPDIYWRRRWIVLLGFLVLFFTGISGLVARYELPPELLPIAFVSLAVAVLWDGRLALGLAAAMAAIIGIQEPFQGAQAWLPVWVAGSAAALFVRAVRRRAQTWIFIAIIFLAYTGTIVALGVLASRSAEGIMYSLGYAGINSVVSAILAMGFLPVFEWFTRITTDQTLLEWADPNRPLLKRLAMEAPGTYAHSINVANLAEAAAAAIGANGLLCRVGVYYHDVGKMKKPQYFIENQPGGSNPHDDLEPAASAAIVRAHVTEGERMAREAGLPEVLVDFITEHHGTQEISFFYERAKEDAGPGRVEVDPAAFRYPGPRPRSRETAIVMLADSIESATRTLDDPTPDRLRELIEVIVETKLERGQLEEAPLTLRELGVVKDQFQKVLVGMYHRRIDYPQTRHITGGGEPEAPAPEVDASGDDGGGSPGPVEAAAPSSAPGEGS
ncbi:MAG: HDIG domain-containing protein [Gammaproteobacteria bacterium]|nr:HDIG domain-containing protein [Gammaproteobacteria bacterium]